MLINDRAAKHELRVSARTQDRIMSAADGVKQLSYNQIEGKLVELITALFPKVSAINGFARNYVDEYFRLWKQAAEWSPDFIRCLGFTPGETSVIARALVRDLVLRLCYLESCERRLSSLRFSEAELALLRHDSPTQVYQALIAERSRLREVSQEKLAEQLGQADDRSLRRLKSGESLPTLNLLLDLKPPETGHRLLAGIGFVDRLLKTLGLHTSVLRHELLPVASVFFRKHPSALKGFRGGVPVLTDGGQAEFEARDFEGFAEYGGYLLLHPGFNELWPEMPDALWRCHLYTLQFARVQDLAQKYLQFSAEKDDSMLERRLDQYEAESNGCRYGWMDRFDPPASGAKS